MLAPGAGERDERHAFPLDEVRAMAELGLFGLPFPEAYGGADAGAMMTCIALEELGRVDQAAGIDAVGGDRPRRAR